MYLGIGTWDVTSEGESVACLSTCSFLEPKLTLKKTFDLVRKQKKTAVVLGQVPGKWGRGVR